MATAPITDNSPKSLLKNEDKHDKKSEKKLTILESHGYTLGKTIGAGSYATVKVCYINSLLKFKKSILHFNKFLTKKFVIKDCKI